MGIKKLEKKEKTTIAYMITLISQIGISMIVPIAICTAGGIWLSKYIKLSLIVPVAVFFGMIVAFRNVYMLVRGIYEEDMKRENEELEYYKELERARKDNKNKQKKS